MGQRVQDYLLVMAVGQWGDIEHDYVLAILFQNKSCLSQNLKVEKITSSFISLGLLPVGTGHFLRNIEIAVLFFGDFHDRNVWLLTAFDIILGVVEEGWIKFAQRHFE